MIHMVMGEHQVLDGLTGILRLGRSDRPVRMPVVHRRIEHYQSIAQLDNQAMMRTTDHVLHAGCDLNQPQPCGGTRVKARVVRIEIGTDELAAQHPLIGHVTARWLRRRAL
jgi:hypothetical protein